MRPALASRRDEFATHVKLSDIAAAQHVVVIGIVLQTLRPMDQRPWSALMLAGTEWGAGTGKYQPPSTGKTFVAPVPKGDC